MNKFTFDIKNYTKVVNRVIFKNNIKNKALPSMVMPFAYIIRLIIAL